MVHLDKVVQAKPDDVDAVFDRAVCEMALDQWDKAIADLSTFCAKQQESFCETVEKVKAQQARATGERRRMTPEEREAWQKKHADGNVSEGRKSLQEKMKQREAEKKKAE
jgi:hypothetical protein